VVSAQNVITLADGEMLMMIEIHGLFQWMHCFTSNDHFAISLTRRLQQILSNNEISIEAKFILSANHKVFGRKSITVSIKR
jgi:hypothetical protein